MTNNSLETMARPIRRLVPQPLKRLLKRALTGPPPDVKGPSELRFWDKLIRDQGTAPDTEYYRAFMMRMGNIDQESFFDGLVCLDIGCGPKGSLTWLTGARAALGLDPLAEHYMRFGIAAHNMIYLAAPAEHIPLPTAYVDVVFSMNSLDHVDDVPATCAEIRRVLKPGGYFLGSLNLDEPPTPTEPWTLTEAFLAEHLFAGWLREYHEVQPKVEGPIGQDPYIYFKTECPPELRDAPGPRALWCRYRVPGPAPDGQ